MAEVLGAVSAGLAIVEAAAKTAITCLKYINGVKNAEKDATRLAREVEHVQSVLKDAVEYCRGIPGHDAAIPEDIHLAAQGLNDQLSKICAKLPADESSSQGIKRWFGRLKWPIDSRDTKKFIVELSRHKENLHLAISIRTGNGVKKIINLQEDAEMRARKEMLMKLPIAADAAHNSFSDQNMPRCHEDTRLELRKEIRDWILDTDDTFFCWLNGMAGTGKSTISRTIADGCGMDGHLAASFFFKRGESNRGDASRLIATLCVQLVKSLPQMSTYVTDVLETEDRIWDRNLSEQFHKLILEPLEKISGAHSGTTMVLIIDALDECENEDQASFVLTLLAKLRSVGFIKVFLTSRPEAKILRSIHRMPEKNRKEIVLHEASEMSIRHDIEIYVKDEFRKIKEEQTYLSTDWPDPQKLTAFLDMVMPLFIFAATMCRLIGDVRIDLPDDQLDAILQYKGAEHTGQLDLTYRPVLDHLVHDLTGDARKKVVMRFKAIIGTIIILAEPLTIASIARLLGQSEPHISTGLDKLRSVLNISKDPSIPVRLFHKSFHDYLLDETKRETNEFWIDEKAMHDETAARCLDLLIYSDHLKQDICSLQSPGAQISDMDADWLSKCLPAEIQYACRFWTDHLVRAGYCISDDDQVHQFLKAKFLFWIEALSLMGRTYDAVHELSRLQGLLGPESDTVSAFLSDAKRFLGLCAEVVHLHPLQLYSSGLVFAPRSSIIRQTFQYTLPHWITRLPCAAESWDPCLNILTGHERKISAIQLSPNGLQLASASMRGPVKLWNVTTGALQHSLANHTLTVRSLMYSEYGLISMAEDMVNIWQPITGELKFELRHPEPQYITGARFVAGHVVVGTAAPNMVIWSVEPAQLVRTIALETQIAMLLDSGSLIITGSFDHIVRFWNPLNGQLVKTIDLTSSRTPDLRILNRCLISCADKITIWDIDTARMVRSTREDTTDAWQIVHTSECIVTLDETTVSYRDFKTLDITRMIPVQRNRSVAACSSMVALADDEPYISLVLANEPDKYYLAGHTNEITHMLFSENNKMLVSGSADSTIRLWDVSRAETLSKSPPVMWRIGLVHLSPSARFAIMGLKYELKYEQSGVGLWDGVTKASKFVAIEEHEGDVVAVTFSPTEDRVITGDVYGVLVVWDPRTEAIYKTIRPLVEEDPAISLAFGSTRNLFASGHHRGSINLWDLDTGVLLQTLTSHSTTLVYLSLSPNDQQLLSGSLGGEVSLWNSDNGSFSRSEGAETMCFADMFNPTTQFQFRRNGRVPRQSRGRQVLQLQDGWIMYKNLKLLWLPHTYRPKAKRFDAMGNVVGLAGVKGEFLLLEFDMHILQSLMTAGL